MRLLALLLSCVALRAADIVGSDLLTGAVAGGLERAARNLTHDFGGTLPGRQAFIDGRASAAVLMVRDREVAPVPAAQGVETLSAAQDVVAFITVQRVCSITT